MRRGIFAYDVLVMRLDMHLDLSCGSYVSMMSWTDTAPWLCADAETPSSRYSPLGPCRSEMDLTI